MKKQTISEKIFYKCKGATLTSKPYTWGEVKEILGKEGIELEDSDVLKIGFEEGWNEGDSARDDMYYVSLERDREETDVEFEKRKLNVEKIKEENTKMRYEQYLKLKEEFENVF